MERGSSMVHCLLLVSRILIHINKLSIAQKVSVGMISMVCMIFYLQISQIFLRWELEWGINVEPNGARTVLLQKKIAKSAFYYFQTNTSDFHVNKDISQWQLRECIPTSLVAIKVAEHSFWYLCFIHLFLLNPWSLGRQNWQQAS